MVTIALKIFAVTYNYAYGDCVLIIIAENQTAAEKMIPANVREWGYTIVEIPFVKGIYDAHTSNI